MNASEQKRKEKWTLVFIVLFVAGFIIWCLWAGISGLFLSKKHPIDELFVRPVKGDVYAGTIKYASNYKKKYRPNRNYKYKWMTAEYYYIVFSEDQGEAIVVCASKNWGSGFGNDFCNEVSLKADGIVRELSYRVEKEMSGVFADFEEQGIRIRTDVYLDLGAKRICRLQLFSGISLLLCTVCIYLLYKNAVSAVPKSVPKGIYIAVVTLILITFIALIYLIIKV